LEAALILLYDVGLPAKLSKFKVGQRNYINDRRNKIGLPFSEKNFSGNGNPIGVALFTYSLHLLKD